MPVVKVLKNGVWEDVSGMSEHIHTKNDIIDFPSSLPANGGNADTVDGKHANEFALASELSTHNTSTSAHNDIRNLISGLTTRLNALADSDDTTLDQMSEIVAYIKSNKSLIDSITTNKVNVSDIVNNLTTNVSNKPLSAAQGVALKTLIDAITVPTKVSELTNDKGYITGYTETDPTVPDWAKSATKPKYTASEVGALPSSTKIPTNLYELSEDTSHRVVTDTEKSTWNGKADKSQAIFYIEGSGTTDTTNKVATWLGSHSDITSYYVGLTILYKISTAGSTTTTLNINNLGAIPVVRNVTSAISTAYAVNSIVMLTYTIDDGTAYWKVGDYDSNTKTTAGTSNKASTKMYLVGATSQSSSGATTYSNTKCYIGSDNCLYSNGAKVALGSDIPTDTHINDLIDGKLGVIENGSY